MPHTNKRRPGKGRRDQLGGPIETEFKRTTPSKQALRTAALHDAPLQALRTRTVARRCSVSAEHARAIAELAFGDEE